MTIVRTGGFDSSITAEGIFSDAGRIHGSIKWAKRYWAFSAQGFFVNYLIPAETNSCILFLHFKQDVIEYDATASCGLCWIKSVKIEYFDWLWTLLLLINIETLSLFKSIDCGVSLTMWRPSNLPLCARKHLKVHCIWRNFMGFLNTSNWHMVPCCPSHVTQAFPISNYLIIVRSFRSAVHMNEIVFKKRIPPSSFARHWLPVSTTRFLCFMFGSTL